MNECNNDKCCGCKGFSLAQLFIPVVVVAMTLLAMLAFQFSQVLHERGALQEAMMRQEKPLEDSQKLQAQVRAIVAGTVKLADGGDKNAKPIVEKLKQLGVIGEPNQQQQQQSQQQPQPSVAPVPAASEKPESGPVKP